MNYRYSDSKAKQTNGTFELSINPAAFSHVFSWSVSGSPTAGTWTAEVKPDGTDDYQTLTVNGVAASGSLTSSGSFGPFDGWLQGARITIASLDAGSITFRVNGG